MTFLETIPWKTITVVAVVLGLVVATVDTVMRVVQTRQQVALVRDIRDLLGLLHAATAEICAATWDMHETLLSSGKDAVLPRQKEAGR